MKKKGFTLVELLAVIVILAIIALIATPLILNVIDNAKKGAAEASANGYIDALEKGIVEEELKGNTISKTGVYEVSSLNFVNVKGDAPTDGWISLNKGIVTDYSLKIDEYVINYDETNKKIITTKNGELDATPSEPITPSIPGEPQTGPTMVAPQSGETHKGIVYLDPTDLTATCNASNSVSTTGIKEGCMKWYAYKEDDTTYTMILDHNTTSTVAWNSKGSHSSMNEVATSLANDTTTWIDSLKTNNVRLIEADEIAQITGNTTFDSATSAYNEYFYFETNTSNKPNSFVGIYAWLYDYTKECTDRGCSKEDSSTSGYWTRTPVSGYPCDAWMVHGNGYLNGSNVETSNTYGVRPVITISKSIIS